MNLKAVRDVLYDITEKFFKGATVIWAEQSNPQPQLPYITIKTGGLTKTAFPICDETTGERYYPCSIPVEINLCTDGEVVVSGMNITEVYANTAVSDLLDFVMFLESDIMVDYIMGRGIEISLVPPVRDLTGILNDSSYRYRSMAEFIVTFNGDSEGPYGVGGTVLPNISGGGTKEMSSAKTDAFLETEITEGGMNNDEE